MKQEEFDFNFFDLTKECSLFEELLYKYENVNFVEIYHNNGNECYPFGENIFICVIYSKNGEEKYIQEGYPLKIDDVQFDGMTGRAVFEKIKSDFLYIHLPSLGNVIDKK